MASLHWWLHTDAGLLARVGIGVLIFLSLAGLDLQRHGKSATRWKEYLFLLCAAGMALAYGLINDQITASISWEYFYYGKGLDAVLGPAIPPHARPFRLEVAKIALKSAWSAGLILGVALLIANNPRQDRPQLPYRTLMKLMLKLLIWPVSMAAVLGLLGYLGLFAAFSADLRDLVRQDLFRPARFMMVVGIHLGAYAGALVAMGAGILTVRKRRRAMGELAAGEPAAG
jgi:hypothetical protein